jgi:hypothetical protein
MRTVILSVLFVFPLLLWAQGLQPTIPGDPAPDEVYEDSEGMNYGLGGAVGAVTMNGSTYSQVQLRPEIGIGKFGFGLDIDLLFDADGNIRKEDWEDWRDYVNKIFYVRYGQKQDPFYFKAGCIPSYTLGHGLIFDHYSNMLRYPDVKNVGAYVGVNSPISGIGFEAFTHNIHRNEILAARVHGNPLQYSYIPFLENFKLGVNVGWDRNQYGKYPDDDGDNIPDVYDKFPENPNAWLDSDDDGIPDETDIDINGTGLIDHPTVNPYVQENYPNITDGADPDGFNYTVLHDQATPYAHWRELLIYSVDYSLPLVQTSHFSLDHYGEYAMIDKYGSGLIFPGFSGNFFIFNAKLEMRNFSDEFLPGYFDRLYDEQRSFVSISELPGTSPGQPVYYLSTKEDLLRISKSSVGWFGHLRADVLDLGYVKLAYQDMYGKDVTTGKSLWVNLTANPHNIMNLKEASISYSQNNTRYINFLEPRNASASVLGRVVYSLGENADLVGRYSEIYNDVNGDGKIRGSNEIISAFAFGVQFIF